MEINRLPKYDASDNPTNCCARFNPEGWDEQTLQFDNKLFVKARTKSLFHIPLNIGSVFPKTFEAIEKAHAQNMDQVIVLSHDLSAWRSEHYFAVTKDVPGQEMVRLTGDFLTRVFEGPYKNVSKWDKEMAAVVKGNGNKALKTYFFFTTCPKCAKFYGKNYIVAATQIQ